MERSLENARRRPGGPSPLATPVLLLALLLLASVLLGGCSPRRYLADRFAGAAATESLVYAGEDDPELVRDSLPTVLKGMESLLEATPENGNLLLSLCRGFTQYAAAFVARDAAESPDGAVREAGRLRSRRLYLRARDYGLRGIEAAHPGFRGRFEGDAAAALGGFTAADVPLLYWTGAAWTLAVAASPDDPGALADLPRFEALLRKALELDEGFDGGAIHEYFVAFEGSRSVAMGGSPERARKHFGRAMELSGGGKVSPLVTMAETVSVRAQDRKEFEDLLSRALAFDADGGPRKWRLSNLVAQRKARWLKGRTDDLFLE